MLTELAITPQVFQPTGKEDWQELMREFAHHLFPSSGASPTLISNLAAGKWQQTLKSLIDRLKSEPENRKARWLLEPLLERLNERLVERPQVGDSLLSEKDWASEAAHSHEIEPLGGLITTTQLPKEKSPHPSLQVATFAQACAREFYKNRKSSGSVKMRINDQLELLRPMLVHARYVAMVLPRLEKSESRFAARLIEKRVAWDRTSLPVQIDLHTDHIGGALANEQLRKRLEEEIRLTPNGRLFLRLLVWPGPLLDRRILCGIPVNSDEVTDGFRCRWGGAIGHFATDNSECDTDWHVYDKADLAKRYRELYDSESRRRNTPAILTVIEKAQETSTSDY